MTSKHSLNPTPNGYGWHTCGTCTGRTCPHEIRHQAEGCKGCNPKITDNPIEKMKTYVSHIIQTYVPHNKAEKALVDEIKKMDRRVVKANEVKDYKKEFQELIQKINSSYPRCKDIELVIFSHMDEDINFRTDVAHLVLFWGIEHN